MIAIVDCNNFYASCERAFNPRLRGKPICILSNNDGCVIARSDEAKALDIPMGAPYHMWKEEFKNKGVHIFSSNYALYGDMSARVMNVLRAAVRKVEMYSIDEAFLDLSAGQSNYNFCDDLAKKVYQYTGIPVSIGLATSKTLAKAANLVGKKHKLKAFEVTPENHETVLAQTSIKSVWGIGRQHTKFLMSQGVDTALAFTKMPEGWIKSHMKTPGLWTMMELKGQPCFPFEQGDQPKKLILASRSFGKPLKDKQTIAEAIAHHVNRAAEKLRRQGSLAGRIGVFMSTDRFSAKVPYTRVSGYEEFSIATADTSNMIRMALMILDNIYRSDLIYQKGGISLSDIKPKNELQFSLWVQEDDSRKSSLLKIVDNYNQMHGKNTIFFAAMGTQKKWALRANFLSQKYTTSFKDLLRLKI